jgi:hypothetical protein
MRASAPVTAKMQFSPISFLKLNPSILFFQNHLQDSLQIFSEVTQNEFLDKTDIIMFLNKHDVLLTKLKRKNIKCCFPDYTGRLFCTHYCITGGIRAVISRQNSHITASLAEFARSSRDKTVISPEREVESTRIFHQRMQN